MKSEEEEMEEETPEEKMRRALRVLLDLSQNYAPRPCRISIDGNEYSGEYLLVEIMNIRSIGPTLLLAGDADPGDGYFDVVLIEEAQRQAFTEYVQRRLDGEILPFQGTTHRGKKIVVSWDGASAHLDDEYLRLDKNTEVKVEIKRGILEFIVP